MSDSPARVSDFATRESDFATRERVDDAHAEQRTPATRPLMSRFRDAVLGPRTPFRDVALDVFSRVGRAEKGDYSALQFAAQDEPEFSTESAALPDPAAEDDEQARLRPPPGDGAALRSSPVLRASSRP